MNDDIWRDFPIKTLDIIALYKIVFPLANNKDISASAILKKREHTAS